MKKTITDKSAQEVEEWKAKYFRALADYQNLERRIATQALEKEKMAAAHVIGELLVVLDTFEAAQEHLNDEGLKIGIGEFQTVLAHHHVKKLEVLGKPFDPNVMECLEVVAGEKNDEVVEVVRPGYTIGDTVLRPALVKVSKKQSS